MEKRTRISVYLMLLFFTIAFSQEGNRQRMPITSSSKKAKVAFEKGISYRDNIQFEAAQKEFDKALRLDPNFVMAKLALASTQRSFKKRSDLFKEIISMMKTAKLSEGEKLFVEGQVSGFNGDRNTAQNATKKLAQLFPNDERVQYNMGLVYYLNNEFNKAIEAFEKSIRINPKFTPVYNLLGYTYRFVGKRGDAERAFKKAIELNPKNPNAYDSYAELLLKMGKYETSIETYEKALETDPLFPSAVMGIASNLLHLKRYDEARMRLSKIMKNAPNDGIRSGVCWAMSVTYLDEGKYDDAIKELENNLSYSKKSDDKAAMAVDKQNIAKLFLEQGEVEKAKLVFDEAYKLSLSAAPNDKVKKNIENGRLSQVALIALAVGDFKKAKSKTTAYMKVAKEQTNQNMIRYAHDLEGRIALREKKYQKAIEEIEKGNKTDAYNMFRVAKAYEALGNKDKAREMYKYVTTYRGALNYNYSLVRHKAEKKLASL